MILSIFWWFLLIRIEITHCCWSWIKIKSIWSWVLCFWSWINYLTISLTRHDFILSITRFLITSIFWVHLVESIHIESSVTRFTIFIWSVFIIVSITFWIDKIPGIGPIELQTGGWSRFEFTFIFSLVL